MFLTCLVINVSATSTVDTPSLSHAKMTVDVTKHLISTSLMHIIISLLLMHIILSNTYKNYHHTNHQKIPII